MILDGQFTSQAKLVFEFEFYVHYLPYIMHCGC